MKKLVVGIGVVLLLIGGCEFNHVPVITNIIVQPAEVGIGDTLSLTCNASDADNDVLTYKWWIDTDTLSVSTSTAKYVVNLSEGTYDVWCEVKDGRGAVATSDTVTVKVVSSGPNPVTLVTATDTTDTKVALVWTQSDASDFLKYEVHVSTTSGFSPSQSTKTADIRSKTDTTYEVTGLSASTDYYFKVLVYNAKEKYSESNELKVTTKPVPPTAVTLRDAYDIKSDELKLSWTPNQDGDFRYYEIHKSTTPDFTPSTATLEDKTNELARNDTLYTVTGLTPGTDYYFKIVVVNQGGARSNSNEIKATTLNYEIVGQCDLRNGHPRDMVSLFGSYIYVAATEGGIVTVNVSGAAANVGGYTVGFYPAYDVHTDGRYLYIAMADTGLHIADAQTPFNNNPALVGILDTMCVAAGGGNVDTCHIGGAPISVYKAGNSAYLGTKVGNAYYLDIVDVSNPAWPGAGDTVTAGSGCTACDTHKVQLPDEPRDIFVSGSYAYIACSGAGLVIVDITASPPLIVGRISFSGDANSVYISGDKAYVAAGANGLVILDISSPTSPSKIYELKDSESDAWDIYVSSPRVYLADGTAGVRIINITDPYHPYEEHHIRVGTDIRTILASSGSTGNFIYAGDWENRFLVVKWE